ncbi:16S rRNA (cytosine(1402)-N(4))-methyltransferase RsmH [Arachidicoccus sp.]|jgi:16S rRNA (cytosine1402-N4)-methyltransferase|uniref:16S rRNA (cytosine(1402)-N(4))-methyltransferase RsmH n=1 Tax=Arachidicoccus sp. TaxID=1872624 RepID=UPI003D1F1D0C
MNKEEQHYHVSVLYKEALEGLHIKPDGIYVDCTFGGGGHSRGILAQLNKKGRLIAFDQDADAQRNLPEDERVIFIPQNFKYLQKFLRLYKFPKVDGVLADLGVSSHQFDEAERGFSIRFDGPLDMRMDKRLERTAASVLASASEKELVEIFSHYGEVSNAKTLAKHITTNRSMSVFATIDTFKNFISPVVKGNPNKYLAQVFQALRIEVNDELGALKEMLEQLPEVLNEAGRAVIITFHSLEDRLVKTFFKQGTFEIEQEHPFLNSTRQNPLFNITKKPIVPSEKELKENKRSRSAKLRIAEMR